MINLVVVMAAQAWAMGAGAQGEGGAQQSSPMSGMFLIGAMFLIFYFFMLRPQLKKQREHQQFLRNLKNGDKIITNGGVIGVITALDDNEITLKIAPEVRIKVGRNYIAGVLKSSNNPANAVDNKTKSN